jgi:hypothetical protein
MKEADPDFVEALANLFGEYAAEEANSESIQKIHEVWKTALLNERKRIFEFMRADPQMSRCDDKEWVVQISYVIGNGTYRTKPSLNAPLSWLPVEEVILVDNDIRSQLMVTRMYVGHWEVRLQSPADPELVANIYIEEDENERETHRVELQPRNGHGAIRIYQTWEQCIHAIVAWVRAGRA